MVAWVPVFPGVSLKTDPSVSYDKQTDGSLYNRYENRTEIELFRKQLGGPFFHGVSYKTGPSISMTNKQKGHSLNRDENRIGREVFGTFD